MLPRQIIHALNTFDPSTDAKVDAARRACILAAIAFIVYPLTRQVPLGIWGIQIPVVLVSDWEPWVVGLLVCVATLYVLWDLWMAGTARLENWNSSHFEELKKEILLRLAAFEARLAALGATTAVQAVRAYSADVGEMIREGDLERDLQRFLESLRRPGAVGLALEPSRAVEEFLQDFGALIGEYRNELTVRTQYLRSPRTPLWLSTAIVTVSAVLSVSLLAYTKKVSIEAKEQTVTGAGDSARSVERAALPYVWVIDAAKQDRRPRLLFPIFPKGGFQVDPLKIGGVPEALVTRLADCIGPEGSPVLEIRGYADDAEFGGMSVAESAVRNVRLANARARALLEQMQRSGGVEVVSSSVGPVSHRRVIVMLAEWPETASGHSDMREAAGFVDRFSGVYREGAAQLNRRAEIVLANAAVCSPVAGIMNLGDPSDAEGHLAAWWGHWGTRGAEGRAPA